MTEVIEEQVTEEGDRWLAVPPPTAPAHTTLFGTNSPAEVVREAAEVATALARIIEERKLFATISGRKHVLVEGWTMLGSMLGVFPVTTWTRELDDGWEARVEARTRDGAIVGAAEAECRRTERSWKSRDSYALRSMAQTRATSKALRLPLGFVVTLAGYEATPAEEMPVEGTATEERIEHGGDTEKVPTTWPKIHAAIFGDNRIQAGEMFDEFVKAAARHMYGEDKSTRLTQTQRDVMKQKAGTVILWLRENVEEGTLATYIDKPTMQRAWASVLEGELLDIEGFMVVVPDREATTEATGEDSPSS